MKASRVGEILKSVFADKMQDQDNRWTSVSTDDADGDWRKAYFSESAYITQEIGEGVLYQVCHLLNTTLKDFDIYSASLVVKSFIGSNVKVAGTITTSGQKLLKWAESTYHDYSISYFSPSPDSIPIKSIDVVLDGIHIVGGIY